MCTRYKLICGTGTSDILYKNCIDDNKRKTITRWRLSSHKLKIETGRYTRPYTERKDRLCHICDVIEDEVHAIYTCRAHNAIRETYKHIVNLNDQNIQQLLNPTNVTDAITVASFLEEIENNMGDLDMIWVDELNMMIWYEEEAGRDGEGGGRITENENIENESCERG